MKRLALFATSALLVAGCATSQPAVSRTADSIDLTVAEAEQIIQAYENRRALRHAVRDADPLGHPKSLDDVLEVLRRDELDLFPEAVRFATEQQGAPALALRGQIELAWGEAQLILDDVLHRASARLVEAKRALEIKASTGALSAADKARLDTLNRTVQDLSGIGEALARIGSQHIQTGAALAEQVIAKAPNDYQGYRVAADYYRLREDWPEFEKMVAKIEQTNPQSNGLVFLRGMEALKRNHDPAKATTFFRQALERDPKFTRAQVQLLLAQPDSLQAFDEFEKLKTLSPQHQIVRWVGGAIEAQHQVALERQEERKDTLKDRAEQLAH